MRVRAGLCLLAVLSISMLIGCGSGGSNNFNSPPPPAPALESISITPDLNSVVAGTTQQLKATGTYSDGSSKDITASVAWTSSAGSVASISKTGLLTAVAAGQAKISASLDTMSGSETVSVTDNLVSISIVSPGTTVTAGTPLQLTAYGKYQDGKPAQPLSNVTWSSSAASIANVSNSGQVNGLKGGSVTITAAVGNISATITLTVNGSLVSISLSPNTSSLAAGATQQFKATGTYSDGASEDITMLVAWSSSANGVAAISHTGLLTAVAAGQAKIDASLNAMNASETVSVTDNLVSISIVSPATTVTAGTPLQLTAYGKYQDGKPAQPLSNVTWSSSASNLATVSSSGLVNGLKGGSVTITAAVGKISGTITLTVDGSLVSISLSPTLSSLVASTTQQLKATGAYSDGSAKDITTTVAWTSSASSVASVSNTGLLTAVAAGQAKISATLGAISGSETLSVTDNLVSISITPSISSIDVGGTLQLQALGKYQDGKPAQPLSKVTWSSSASNLATVSSSGLVTGVKGGTVTITASSGAVSSTLQLSVVPVLQTIAVSPVGPAIVVGGAQQFTATGFYNDASVKDLTAIAVWSSSDTTKASVNNSGVATGVAAGPSAITATSAGINGTTALNVVSKVYATLEGSYAFTLEASDSRGAALYAGSITVDGKGNFTGLEDCNTASGVQQDVTSGGTYLIYPDGRGNIIFNANKCHANGITLRVILTSAGTAGGLAEFDGLGIANGNLIQQNTAAFNAAAINGTYVFQAAGIDTRVNAAGLVDGVGEVGMFAADGAGNVSSGVEDINDNGTITGQVALTASTYSVNADGRGTLQMINSSGTSNYALYVIDSTRFIFLQTDSIEAVSGVAEQQTVQTYSTLSDTYSFMFEPPAVVYAGNPSPIDDHVQSGKLNFNTSGTLGGTRDGNQITGQYALSQFGINGRGQMQMTGDDNRIYFFYMVSPQKMFVLQAFTYSQTQRVSPAIGEADEQTGAPFSVATLTGTYGLETYNLAQNATNLAWLTMDGTGGVDGVSDFSQGNAVSSVVVSNPVFITIPTVYGNGDVEMKTPSGTIDYLFYLVSPQEAWVVGLNPPLDGTLVQQ